VQSQSNLDTNITILPKCQKARHDETLLNFILKKTTQEREKKKKQTTKTKVQANNQPKRGMLPKSKGTTKY
jgi:hypothetical protein